MMPRVPALATASTAHCSTCDGASPGCQRALLFGCVLRDQLLDFLARTPLLLLRLCTAAGCAGDGVDADGVDRAVDADAAGQVQDRLDGVLLLEVDHLGPLARAMSSREAMRSTAKTRPAPLSMRADDGELPDRAAAEDRHGVAGLDLGQLGAEVAGREDVGEHDRLVVGRPRRAA